MSALLASAGISDLDRVAGRQEDEAEADDDDADRDRHHEDYAPGDVEPHACLYLAVRSSHSP